MCFGQQQLPQLDLNHGGAAVVNIWAKAYWWKAPGEGSIHDQKTTSVCCGWPLKQILSDCLWRHLIGRQMGCTDEDWSRLDLKVQNVIAGSIGNVEVLTL